MVLKKDLALAFKYKHSPIKWRAVLAESGFIGASILLAFALQDWDEGKDIEQRTLIALCNVKSELAFNRVLLKSDYLPRQQGMLRLSQAAITQLSANPEEAIPNDHFETLLMRESLRYSAWTLAGESGYLVYANFQLATEIGALIDYQEDRYRVIVDRINNAVIDLKVSSSTSTMGYYISLTDMITEWIKQTEYLESKYDTLFEREDFQALQCEE